ncbi:MAG: glycine--tRNA ligase, partial [Bacilli bacterium]|nr:glycine--tRNA ligase [Bacilli bacterium]
LIELHSKGKVDADGWSHEKMREYIEINKVKCPVCGNFNYTDIRNFNLMFKTHQGVLEDDKNLVYLRPETAQGIFLDFKNVLRTSRKKIPFGIGQIGKSFRNEITPGNFIFRTREFEQMELEFFCKPGTELKWFDYWRSFAIDFLKTLGLSADNLKLYDHPQEKLSFYSNATTDILYRYPWGFDELWGIASRTDYDLKQHQEHSKENLEYLDPETSEKYLPFVIEPSLGVERLLLAILNDALVEEVVEQTNEIRTLLKIDKRLAPYKVAVLPLVKKYHQEKTESVFENVLKRHVAVYDDTGNIGRRYRRQDAIGTPYCVTIDNQTTEDDTVTVRDRDTMEQVRVPIGELNQYLQSKLDL